MNIVPPNPTRTVADENGEMGYPFRDWTQAVSQLSILEGSGSPDGIEEALPTRFYMDTSGAAGSILYIKQVADIGGDKSLGWVLV